MKQLTNYIVYGAFLWLCMLQTGCFKTVVSNESDPLNVSIDASTGSVSLAPVFPVVVTINSKINTNIGIEIKNVVMEELSGLPVEPQAPATKTTIAQNNTAIINLPRQKWCVVNIVVTDIGNTNNTVTKSFRLIYK